MKAAVAGAVFLSAFAALPAQAEVLDMNFSGNAIYGDFSGPVARFLPGTTGQYDFGLISRPHSKDGLFTPHVGLLLTGDAGLTGIDLAAGIGLRALYIGLNHNHGGAIAPGGQFEVRLPQFNRLGLSGYTYYAPSVTGFGDISRYWEYGAALGYEVIRNGSVYVGYRNVHLNVDHGGSIAADNGIVGGFRIKF